jgi:hypothetical protein
MMFAHPLILKLIEDNADGDTRRATNLVDQKMMYVGISRAKDSATIYTNDRGKLIAAINERAGLAQTALPAMTAQAGLAKSAGAALQ